jgi:hypothetical protein
MTRLVAGGAAALAAYVGLHLQIARLEPADHGRRVARVFERVERDAPDAPSPVLAAYNEARAEEWVA